MATIDERLNKSGVITYRVRIRKTGSRPQTKFFKRRTDAKTWARQVEADISRGKHTSNKRKRHLFSEAVQKYREEVLPTKPKSADGYARHLDFWDDCFGFRYCNEITKADIRSARSKLKKKKTRDGENLSPVTVNRYIQQRRNPSAIRGVQRELLRYALSSCLYGA